MSGVYTLSPESRTVHLPAQASLPAGTVLATRYTITGPADAPLIVTLGGISAHRDAADRSGARGWWRNIVGPGLALDTNTHRVLSFDWIGGPEAPLPPQHAEFVPTTSLQAHALKAILDQLDCGVALLVVGASYGGLVAQSFAEAWPERLSRLALLCCAHRADPQSRVQRGIQRDILRLARRCGTEREGVELARTLALLSYRTAADLRAREQTTAQPIERWLTQHSADFAARFSAAHYLALSASLDAHDSDPTRLQTPLSALAVIEDALVPIQDVEALVRTAGAASLKVVSSRFGHDAFLKETGIVTGFLRSALDCAQMQKGATAGGK